MVLAGFGLEGLSTMGDGLEIGREGRLSPSPEVVVVVVVVVVVCITLILCARGECVRYNE